MSDTELVPCSVVCSAPCFADANPRCNQSVEVNNGRAEFVDGTNALAKENPGASGRQCICFIHSGAASCDYKRESIAVRTVGNELGQQARCGPISIGI
jgi:hypothetical protein